LDNGEDATAENFRRAKKVYKELVTSLNLENLTGIKHRMSDVGLANKLLFNTGANILA